MPNNKLSMYVHLVWATWDRERSITPEVKRPLFRLIESEAVRQRCSVLAVNGAPDHVHLLVTLPPPLSLADLVKQLKGTSSRRLNETVALDHPFRWQGCYGAFSVSRWDIRKVINYINGQKAHHESGHLIQDLEETEEYNEYGDPVAQLTD